MKKLIIGFSKPKNRFFPVASWLIRAHMGTQYSHVYLKFYSSTLSTYIIYESVGSGVRFVGSAMWEKHAETVDEFVVAVPDPQYLKILKYCVENAGKPYSFWQNVGIAIADWLNLDHNPISRGPDTSNCSEEIALILLSLGYQVHRSPDLITPRDLYEILSQSGTFTK